MKYWKALTAAAMLLGLTACGGGGGGDDKNDPPPPPPGTQGALVMEVKTPMPTVQADGSTKLSVEFKIADKNGTGYDLGTTIPSFTLAKLIPGRLGGKTGDVEGPTVWKSFVYGGKTDSAAKPGSDNKGSLEVLGNGSYKYTFSFDPTTVIDPYPGDSAATGGVISWDDSATHRLGIFFGDSAKNTDVVTVVKDWVPSGASPVLTRDILEHQSCDTCHMKQPIHHTTRGSDPKLCVTCHNGSVPTSTRRPLAVVVHDFHSAGKTPKGANYPQDPRNCDTCHKPQTTSTPDANNWTVPTETTCKACHADMASPVKEHHTDEDCRQCHADSLQTKAGVTNVHFGRLSAMHKGADTLKLDFKSARYDSATKAVTVELNISIDGVGINDIETELKPFTYLNAGLLVNLDEGEGNVVPNSHSSVLLKDCASMGSGNFVCTTPPLFADDRVPASDAVLNVAVSDMGLCVDKNALDPGKSGKPALLTCKTLPEITADHFEYITPPNVPVAHFDLGGNPITDYATPVGADKALCSNCHKDFAIHFSGSAYDHAARDLNQCANCHNATRAATSYTGDAADLKYRVHRYHSQGSHYSTTGSPFPGKLNNCEGCHNKEQYNLPNQKNARPSFVSKSTGAGPDKVTGTKDDTRADMYYSPTLVVCASCHLKSPLGNVTPDAPAAGDEFASHMKENGAVFGADTIEAATGQEQCSSCHAVGQDQGVDKVHKVYDFR